MKMETQHIDRSRNMEERKWWDLWNTSYRSEDDRDVTSMRLFAHVAELIGTVTHGKPGRALEIACGTGALSRQVNFSSYHGLDISPAAIDIARMKAEKLCEETGVARSYEAADFHDWPLPPDPVDLVLCIDAISCFRQQQFVLCKMAEALCSGGLCIITTVNPLVYNRIRRVGGVKLENGPVSHWIPRKELQQMVLQTGLSIQRSYTIMPRGNMGFLRILNSPRLNEAFGPRCAALFQRLKERAGLGQYSVVVARKK